MNDVHCLCTALTLKVGAWFLKNDIALTVYCLLLINSVPKP